MYRINNGLKNKTKHILVEILIEYSMSDASTLAV